MIRGCGDDEEDPRSQAGAGETNGEAMTVGERSCAINEQTADGNTVGRCWFFVGDKDVCPRHGDVEDVMHQFRQTGKLTLEQKHKETQNVQDTNRAEIP